MADRPEYHPDFAMDNVVDPVSGQNNSAKPPAPYPARGWARNEIPPRQYDNWLKRTIAQWIRWLEQKVDEFSGIFNAATPEATPETLMSRDEDGRSQVADPQEGLDAANKRFVDDEIIEAISDATPNPTPSTLMARDPFGRSRVEDPAQGKDISNKDYVDQGAKFFSFSGLDIRPERTLRAYGNYSVQSSGLLRVTILDFVFPPRFQAGHFVKISSVTPEAGQDGPALGVYQVRAVTIPGVAVSQVLDLNHVFGVGGTSGECEIEFLDLSDVPYIDGVSSVILASTGVLIVNPDRTLPLNVVPPPGISIGYNHRHASGSARPTSGSAWLQVIPEPIGLTEPFKAPDSEHFVIGSSKLIVATGSGSPSASPSVSAVAYRT